jgi:mannose-6-phosphate isomerase-like protein (cupin superfamily)
MSRACAFAALLIVACGGGQPSRRQGATTTATTTGDDRELEVQRASEQASEPAPVTAASGEAVYTHEESDRVAVPSVTTSSTPPSPPTEDVMSLSVGSMTGGTEVELPPNLGPSLTYEPSPITLVGFAVAPSVPTRVLIGTLELPPGGRFVPPASSCQDTLLYVTSGMLDASGTGIASVDSPATLYEGDAVRFGPEGDGLVVNTSGERVSTVVALARSEDGGPARIALDERSDHALCPSSGSSDALSRPQRVASFGTSPPLSVMDGTLEVRILLDADAAGAEHAGLAVLSASPSFAVPEHVHDEAAEVLYFEDGAGTMQIGEHAIDVAAGMTVYVPEGTPHSFTSAGTRPMRAIQFYAPSGPEQRFRGMSGGS